MSSRWIRRAMPIVLLAAAVGVWSSEVGAQSPQPVDSVLPVEAAETGVDEPNIVRTLHSDGRVSDVCGGLIGPVAQDPIDLAIATGGGLWVLTADGAVLGVEGAVSLGGLDPATLAMGESPVAIIATGAGSGYWLVSDHGRVVPFGTAFHHGDVYTLGLATVLQGPIVNGSSTSTGNGYYLVGSDGGVFAFGDATFTGSIQQTVNATVGFGFPALEWLAAPIVDIIVDRDDLGYWLIGRDGGVFAFDAKFHGSIPGILQGPQPLSATAWIGGVQLHNGYLLVSSSPGEAHFADGPPTRIRSLALIHGCTTQVAVAGHWLSP